MRGGVIFAILVAICLGVASGQGDTDLPSRQPLDSTMGSSAQKAVQEMVNEVMKGNVKLAFANMYPRWKKKAAKRHGGMLKLEKEMAVVVGMMRKNGVSILSYKAGMPKSGFEVWPEAEKKLVNGVRRATGRTAYRDWVVFVPTVARYRVVDPTTKKTRVIERRSFQVAVMTKGEGKWTFIDGSNMELKDLRNLFPSLPRDEKALMLPKRGGSELKVP